ncbi:MAG: MBL fold metallo-hydrolase [Fimbriimonadales bacterium]
MNNLELIVFDVDHGLCVLVKTPNGYGVMIDAGCSDEFKPADWIGDGAVDLVPFQGHKIAWMVVTHPHDDHVEGIGSVIEKISPSILLRRKDYDWNAILNPPDGDPSENAKVYENWQRRYSSPVIVYPDLGCEFKHFSLTVAEAESLGGQLQNQVNNTSYVCVFATSDWKIVVCGDNESASLDQLCSRPDFRAAISGADVLVTPHHGHRSGYSEKFMTEIGEQCLRISSVPKKDQHIDPRYGAAGSSYRFKDQSRGHLTTRNDGHIRMILKPERFYTFGEVKPTLAMILKNFSWLK